LFYEHFTDDADRRDGGRACRAAAGGRQQTDRAHKLAVDKGAPEMAAGAEISGFEVEEVGLVREGDGDIEFPLLDRQDQGCRSVAMGVGQRKDGQLRFHDTNICINLRS